MKRLVLGLLIASSSALTATAVTQPDALGGLAFWVRADAGVTTNASGRVNTWADQSGRGHDVAATNTEPAFIANEPGLNNRPTLRFNGSSQKMTVANRILTNGIEGCTIIAMAKASIDNNPCIVGIRTGAGNPLMQLDQDGTGHLRFIVRNASGTATANALSAQAPHTGTYGMYAGKLFKSATALSARIFTSSSCSPSFAISSLATHQTRIRT